MKRLFLTLLIVLWSCPSFAADECSLTSLVQGSLNGARVSTTTATIDCEAGAGASTFEALLVDNVSGMITSFVFMPGATTPTNLMDMTITDSDGFDLLMLQGMDLDTSTDTKKTPIDSDGKYFPAEFQENFTITLTNNSVNAATLKIKVNIIP